MIDFNICSVQWKRPVQNKKYFHLPYYPLYVNRSRCHGSRLSYTFSRHLLFLLVRCLLWNNTFHYASLPQLRTERIPGGAEAPNTLGARCRRMAAAVAHRGAPNPNLSLRSARRSNSAGCTDTDDADEPTTPSACWLTLAELRERARPPRLLPPCSFLARVASPSASFIYLLV